ncbi:hypothetical protein vB_AbaM_Acibel004_3 [Acinetobacter phage vB_AbaM_Acibel004]|uniref:hypothetical protein n=1 Tax=Acinetobacter phage vB_AbaM_Acibel004 TaxID=1481186 RepID=UPI0004E83BB1|nr:hypothetical protein vB_AbaM_Acibel004_3 [Acinetobacter phage vB_AbaM_Acibel004]AHY26618.1 hypothetical protein vB_AbaM_Acibel004_3 [Acinetobacter phage vB_AbaM_Acibel004]
MFGKALLKKFSEPPMIINGVFNGVDYSGFNQYLTVGRLNFYNNLIGETTFLTAKVDDFTVSILVDGKSFMKGQEPVTSFHVEVLLKDFYRSSTVLTDAVLDDERFGCLHFTDVLKRLFGEVNYLETLNILEV